MWAVVLRVGRRFLTSSEKLLHEGKTAEALHPSIPITVENKPLDAEPGQNSRCGEKLCPGKK